MTLVRKQHHWLYQRWDTSRDLEADFYCSATMKDLKIIIYWKKRNKAEIDYYDTRFMFPLLSIYIPICPNFMGKIFNT